MLAATIGATHSVDFSPTLVSNFCDITSTAGSLAVEKKRGLITSDASLSNNFSGTPSAGTLSVASNLTSTGTVIVDPPKLSGGTTASTSELKLGNGAYTNTPQSMNLGTDGNLASTNLHVRFTTTANSNKFANGTYSAVATVTCTDDATR
ncbi:MAG: hypothetical protein EBX49_03460 [Synechococcaceae bacterium WB8_1B_136]|nr:hypothetical protein [Synechococcaceae bacterium WB8_1B_136]